MEDYTETVPPTDHIKISLIPNEKQIITPSSTSNQIDMGLYGDDWRATALQRTRPRWNEDMMLIENTEISVIPDITGIR